MKIKIKKEDDIDTISTVIFDFFNITIFRLINEGIDDTFSYFNNDIHEHLVKFIKDLEKPTTKEEKYLHIQLINSYLYMFINFNNINFMYL